MKLVSTLRILRAALPLLMPGLAAAQCIQTFPYFENFEGGAGGWTASSITPSGTGAFTWVLADPNNPVINSAASGVKCWITGNNPFLLPPLEPYSYIPNEFSAVRSPCFDFSGLQNPGIQVKVFWECEFSQDGAVLQSSIDNGLTWQRVGGYLEPVFWYNDNSIVGGTFGGPGGQQTGWTGTAATGTGSAGWVTAQHPLTGLAGQPNVLLRFAFASDAVASPASLADGFAFDDVLIADMPRVNLGPDTVVCFADTVFFNVCTPSAESYQWNTGPLDTLCTQIGVNSGQYVVTVRDTFGFIVRDTMNLVVSSTFVNLANAALICPGDTLLLDAGNPGVSTLWLPGGQTTQILPVSSSGTYTVILNDPFGCSETDSIDVAVDQVPVVDLGADTTICAGESLVLDAGQANPGTTYQWTPNGAQTQAVFVSAPGNYIVVVTTAAGCVTSDTVNITVALDPVVSLGADRSICQPTLLNAGNPGSSYLWSTGATSQSITVGAGTYWVRVTNAFDCASSDTVVLTQSPTPIVNLGPNPVICNNQPVVLNAGNPGASYLWSTGATSQSITVGQQGTYIVAVTNAGGCTSRDTVQVLRSNLNVSLGPDRTLCTGDPLLLNAGGGGVSYLWSTGANSQTLTVNSGGTYSVAVTDNLGCTDRDTVVVNAQTPVSPQFSVAGSFGLGVPLQFSDQTPGSSSAWLWDFGDGATATTQNAVHSYQSVGTFNACLTVTQGVCVRQSCQEVRIQVLSSREEELFSRLDLYPNPSRGLFTLEADLNSPALLRLEVSDLAGRRLLSQEAGSGVEWRAEIDLRGHPDGFYLLRIQAGEASVYRRLQLLR